MLTRHIVKALVKAASPYEGMQQHSLYKHAPIGKKRELSPEEKAEIEEGQSRWMPEIFQSYATKPKDMMASPGKQSLLYGLGGGLAGAGLGGMAGAAISQGGAGGTPNPNTAALGAMIGALGVGGTSALLSYLSQDAKNKGLVDQIQRLPRGATKRDLLSDPVYNEDQYRGHMGNDLRSGLAWGAGRGIAENAIRGLV